MQFQIVPVTHYQQNCSVVWCQKTERGAVVDPGGDIERIQQVIDQAGITVEKILLTHGHMDHVGGTNALRAKLDVPVVGPHTADNFWLQALPQEAQMMGFATQDPLSPTQWLAHGDEVKVGQSTLKVLHCPGHTPGHVVFYDAEDKLAWVGDVLFAGSIGRTDFPQGNHEQLIHAIRTHLWPLGDDVRFIPGHGPMSTIGEERKTNPFVADNRFG